MTFLKFYSLLLSLITYQGLARPGIKTNFQAQQVLKGLSKNALCSLLSALLIYLIDKVMPGNSEAVKLVVCLFYIGNEGMSIIENADKIGIPIPEFLRKRFITMKKENDEHTKYEENHEYEHTEKKLCNTEKSSS